jgi:thiol-disulfide isomerase/thioredoxin
MMRQLPAGAFLFVMLALVSCAPRTQPAAPAAPAPQSDAPKVSTPSPSDELFGKAGFDVPSREIMATDFNLQTPQGKKMSLASVSGKVVVLSFWATWCVPCQQEMPEMQTLYKELQGKGFEILAVDVMEDKVTVEAFLKAHGYTFPVLLDSDGKVAGMYGAEGLPTNFVIDAKKRILARVVGIGGPTWTSPEMHAVFAHLLSP